MTLSSTGTIGEQYAAHYLVKLGYTILERNFRTRLGELDIIAQKNNILHFCEVKTRIGDSHGKPYEAVGPRKMAHIKRVATAYILQKAAKNSKLSIQIIAVTLFPDKTIREIKMYEADY